MKKILTKVDPNVRQTDFWKCKHLQKCIFPIRGIKHLM